MLEAKVAKTPVNVNKNRADKMLSSTISTSPLKTIKANF
jgi:hypothetical protein